MLVARGLGGGKNGSYYLMNTEFLSGKMKVLDMEVSDGCTMCT